MPNETRLRIALLDLEEVAEEAAYHQARLDHPETPPDEKISAGAHVRYYNQIASRKRREIARLKGQVQEVLVDD